MIIKNNNKNEVGKTGRDLNLLVEKAFTDYLSRVPTPQLSLRVKYIINITQRDRTFKPYELPCCIDLLSLRDTPAHVCKAVPHFQMSEPPQGFPRDTMTVGLKDL